MAKLMNIRTADVCAGCADQLPGGTRAYWLRDAREVWCQSCHERAGTPEAAKSVEMQNAAGASAMAEYERRRAQERLRKQKAIDEDAAWRQTVVEQRPVLGRLARVVTPKPSMGSESQATTAWKVGAEGERRVADVLATADDLVVLHDRLVPGSKANIDHIAIGPAGICVIDAKKYSGAVEMRDKGGWLSSDRRLFVAGRDRTKLIDGVRKQVAVVADALPESLSHVPIRGVLCFVGAEWPLLKKPLDIGGVTAVWPRGLAKVVTAGSGGVWIDNQVVARELGTVLIPAT